jgi:threonine dehydratase
VAQPPVGLPDVEAAAQRIAGEVRRTPLLAAAPAARFAPAAVGLQLKLENLQVTGSFKARGAANKVLSLPADEAARGLVTASGGNHGLAVAWAGGRAGLPTTVFLPARTAPEKAGRISAYGAQVVRGGELWDEAHREALAFAEREGRVYVHAFDDAVVVAGQGTIALEILAEAPATELLVVAVGGGGLISGIALAAKALRPQIRIVGVEPEGAPTLHDSLRAGALVELAEVRTAALTLAARRSAELNFEIVRRAVEDIVLVSDEQMRQAARWLWREHGVAAELSGAAAVAALLFEKVPARPGQPACGLVCGAGTDGIG